MKTPDEWFRYYSSQPMRYGVTHVILDAQQEAIKETEEMYGKIIHDILQDSNNYQRGVEDTESRLALPDRWTMVIHPTPGMLIGDAIKELIRFRDRRQERVIMSFNGFEIIAEMDDTEQSLQAQWLQFTESKR